MIILKSERDRYELPDDTPIAGDIAARRGDLGLIYQFAYVYNCVGRGLVTNITGPITIEYQESACPVCHEVGGNYYCTGCGHDEYRETQSQGE